jgi:hypothetical protein
LGGRAAAIGGPDKIYLKVISSRSPAAREPFEGLLLGLFFIAVGISMDLSVLVGRPVLLLAIVMGPVAIGGD